MTDLLQRAREAMSRQQKGTLQARRTDAPLTGEILTRASPASPCIGTCRIDTDGLCEGCRRTLDEIAVWGSATVEERWQIVGLLSARRPAARS